MGYDFMYLRLKRPATAYPFEPDKDFDFFSEVQELPEVEPLVKYLRRHGGFRPNGSNKDGTVWYWWDTPDGGSLNLQLSPDRLTIHVDTHTHWKYVAELLVYLQRYIDNLLVLDKQSTLIHDKESYEAFVVKSYSGQ